MVIRPQVGPSAVLRLTRGTRLPFPLNSLVAFVDSYRNGTLGGLPMGRGLPAPTSPDTGRGVGALLPVSYACDRWIKNACKNTIGAPVDNHRPVGPINALAHMSVTILRGQNDPFTVLLLVLAGL
nr:hypothetical protein [Oryza sativa Japonica Group]ABF96537.1 hypothetical protein LOC_Os03g29420 [Oryza sativa Japonica Group]